MKKLLLLLVVIALGAVIAKKVRSAKVPVCRIRVCAARYLVPRLRRTEGAAAQPYIERDTRTYRCRGSSRGERRSLRRNRNTIA